MLGERRAIKHTLLPVRAHTGGGVLGLGCSQQGRAIVNKRLPALFPEVSNVLSCVLLQVGEPAQTRTELQRVKDVLKRKKKKNPSVHLHAEWQAYTVFLSCLSSLLENSLRIIR